MLYDWRRETRFSRLMATRLAKRIGQRAKKCALTNAGHLALVRWLSLVAKSGRFAGRGSLTRPTATQSLQHALRTTSGTCHPTRVNGQGPQGLATRAEM